jgi:hypothetical protein
MPVGIYCAFCGKVYSSKYGTERDVVFWFSKHLVEAHDEASRYAPSERMQGEPYQCPFDDQGFTSYGQYMRHMFTEHGKGKEEAKDKDAEGNENEGDEGEGDIEYQNRVLDTLKTELEGISTASNDISETMNDLSNYLDDMLERPAGTPYTYADIELATGGMFDAISMLGRVIQWSDGMETQALLKDATEAVNELSKLDDDVRASYNAIVPILQNLALKRSELGGYIRATLGTLKREYAVLFKNLRGTLRELINLAETQVVSPEAPLSTPAQSPADRMSNELEIEPTVAEPKPEPVSPVEAPSENAAETTESPETETNT